MTFKSDGIVAHFIAVTGVGTGLLVGIALAWALNHITQNFFILLAAALVPLFVAGRKTAKLMNRYCPGG